MYISFFIYVLPVIAAACIGVYLAVYFSLRKRIGKRPFARHAAICIFITYCASLVYLTILWYYPNITFTPDYYFLNLQPFIWVNEVYDMGVQKMLMQLAANIGMFVPLGLLLPVVFGRMRRFWKTALAVLAVTLFIETLQYFMGRSADIDDVIMNLAGGIAGYGLYLLNVRIFGKRRFWQRLSMNNVASC